MLVFIISYFLLIFSGFSEAGELWTKYDIGDSSINSLSNFGENIWVASQNNGLIRLNRLNGDKKIYSKNNGLPDSTIRSVCCDKNGFVYAGVRNFDSQSRILSTSLVYVKEDSLIDFTSRLLLQYRHRDFVDSIFFCIPTKYSLNYC